MNKKKSQKALTAKLSVITDIYTEQKGKQKREELLNFIKLKIDEILAFKKELNKKKKGNTEKIQQTVVQPSEQVLIELSQKVHENGEQLKQQES